MGEFTRRARLDMKADAHIPGPLQRKFTPQRWTKAFQEAGEPDSEDKDIYAAGLAIHEKLTNIRSMLKVSTAQGLSATTKLRCFVAAVNHNMLLASKKTHDAIEKVAQERSKVALDGFTFEELTNVKLTLPGGIQVSPDAMAENLVDGVETPISVALSTSPDLTGNPHMGDVEWRDIVLELNLGVFFRHAEDVWDDCLWNGYKMVEKGKARVFGPKEPDHKRAHVIGIARRRSLAMAFTVVARQVQLQLAAMGFAMGEVREVRAIERAGKRQVLKISKPGEVTAAQEQLQILREYASEPYYTELLQEKAPGLDGLTLNDVLAAWTVVSRASQLLMESLAGRAVLEADEDAPPQTWLPQFAPVLQVDAIVTALRAAAGYGPQAARKLVDFLTYRGERDREIWSQPLIPVGPATVAPVFAAVINPNLRRLVDVWMRQAGIDLGKRGDAFEAHIRSTVRQAIAESKLLTGSASSLAEDYTFTPPGEAGVQFDLVFFIGATVFVVEAKCILEPTEAKGVAMHRKTVREAADQALHRVGILEANRAGFVADLKQRFGIDLAENFKIVPLVLLSTSTHVGIPAKGVAVIDEYILERFLAGELEDVAVQGGDMKFVDRAKTLFYADAAEAEARAPDYFANPPQMRRFIGGVEAEFSPFPAVTDGDWEGAVVTFHCVPKDAPPALAARAAR